MLESTLILDEAAYTPDELETLIDEKVQIALSALNETRKEEGFTDNRNIASVQIEAGEEVKGLLRSVFDRKESMDRADHLFQMVLTQYVHPDFRDKELDAPTRIRGPKLEIRMQFIREDHPEFSQLDDYGKYIVTEAEHIRQAQFFLSWDTYYL